MGLYEDYEKKIIEAFENKSDVGKYQPLLKALKEAMQKYDTAKIKELLTNELKEYDFSFLHHLIDKSLLTVSYSDDKFSEITENEKDFERLELEIMAHPKAPIFKTNRNFSFKHVKEIINSLYKRHNQETKPFIISKSHKIAGRVVYQLFNAPKRVSLVREYEDKNNKKFLSFIGDPPKKIMPEDETDKMFFFHEFEDGVEKYLLLSETPIKPQECVVEGMVINMNEDIKVGENMLIGGKRKILLVNTIRLTEKNLSEEEARKISANWNREIVAEKIFGKYRHPPIFEELVMSWLFSGDFDGYPLHLFVMGPNASGKTRGMIVPLSNQFPDGKPGLFIDGATNRIMGLVPSFKNSAVNPGLIIRSFRICYIDEFLKIIIRAGKNLTHDVSSGLEALTSLLEHHASIVSSGNTEPTELVATCKVFATTNPERTLGNLVECIDKLTAPLMARFLFYNQTTEHVNFVAERMSEISALGREKANPKRDLNMINLYDFFNSKPVLSNEKIVNIVHKKLFAFVPEGAKEIYRGRYIHHIACLADGVSKTRWLCNEKDSLVCDEKDYERAEALMYFIVSSWNSSFNIEQIPVHHREDYLSIKERDVWEKIKAGDGVYFCEEDEKNENLVPTFKKLVGIGLVVKMNDYYFPYFHEEAWIKKAKVIDI